MAKNGQNSGANPFNETSSDINKVAYAKTMMTIRINDKWREMCSEDPTLPFKMSFLEFRKKELKKINKRK
jgi:hypothetical protein